jgi:hypothetical protein
MCGRGSGSELLLNSSVGQNIDKDPILKPGLDESLELGFHRSALFRITSLTRAVSDANKAAKQHNRLQNCLMALVCTRLIATQSRDVNAKQTGSEEGINITLVRNEHGLKSRHVLSLHLEI